VALPAVAAASHAALRLLVTAGRAAIDRYLLATGPTAANLKQEHVAARWDRQSDRRILDRFIDPAPCEHTHTRLTALFPGLPG